MLLKIQNVYSKNVFKYRNPRKRRVRCCSSSWSRLMEFEHSILRIKVLYLAPLHLSRGKSQIFGDTESTKICICNTAGQTRGGTSAKEGSYDILTWNKYSMDPKLLGFCHARYNKKRKWKCQWRYFSEGRWWWTQQFMWHFSVINSLELPPCEPRTDERYWNFAKRWNTQKIGLTRR